MLHKWHLSIYLCVFANHTIPCDHCSYSDVALVGFF